MVKAYEKGSGDMTEVRERIDAAPAIAGGAPAKTTPFTRPVRYGEDELNELREALEQGTLFYAQGKKVHQFEQQFAAQSGVRFGIACSSGTAAIHAALIALGVSPGDEVITSPITDAGTLVPILYQGAVPVFADLHPNHYTLDPAAVEAAVTDRTRAVLAVHLAGNASDLTALSEICSRRGLDLVEDCAQALGCRYQGRPIGSFGRAGCFSLNEFKHISCGDGGIVITDDETLAERLRLATDKGYNRKPGVKMRSPVFLANNYRMTELQAAVALAQLRKLDGIAGRRREWCAALNERVRGTRGLELPAPEPGCDPSWWFYLMRVIPEILRADATQFAAALAAEGLPVSAHYIGQCVYEYPIFTEHSLYARPSDHAFNRRDYRHGLCPTAEAILNTGVILQINESYTNHDLGETAHAIRRTAGWFARSK
ncbi:MAG TPA: DegT/DnrJ/EryC1/StrS family aminotransferase [Armatimonadota bacterium]|nr:DegT/DnrJ/EryC1/StrS family aminotransferase [Armatimonadota bacterium]